MRDNNLHFYEDIINMEHHVSKKHPPMKLSDRAAQFGSFAALSGHSDAVKETARLTEIKDEQSDFIMETINTKLTVIRDNTDNLPLVTLTYFVPDETKDGGAYVTQSGQVRKIDEVNGIIHFTDGAEIKIDMLRNIESDIFTFISDF